MTARGPRTIGEAIVCQWREHRGGGVLPVVAPHGPVREVGGHPDARTGFHTPGDRAMDPACVYLRCNDYRGRPSGTADRVEVDFRDGHAILSGRPLMTWTGVSSFHLEGVDYPFDAYIAANAGPQWDTATIEAEVACRMLARLRDLGWHLADASSGLAFLWGSGAEITPDSAMQSIGGS